MAAALALLSVAVFALVFARPCPAREAWGVRCPFCGTQRAMEALGRGDLPLAFYWNAPLLPVCLLLLLAVFRPPRSGWWITGFIFAALVFGVVRNLAFYPLY